MNRGGLLGLILSLAGICSPLASTSDTVLGACDLDVLGAEDKGEFLRFDGELRRALRDRDSAAMALLVDFPLRINQADGSRMSVLTPDTLRIRFEEIFTPKIVKAVLEQRVEEIFCNWTGVMYGGGDVWVGLLEGERAPGYRVYAVNKPNPLDLPAGPRTRLSFVCDTGKLRAVVETHPDDEAWLRVWKGESSASEPPDLVLRNGEVDYQGTGPCGHHIWKFLDGETRYSIVELGCTDGREPRGATGRLAISGPGSAETATHCF